MSPFPPHYRLSTARSGAALVLVLTALAIISFLAIVILTFSRSETRSSRTTADLVQVRMLAAMPEKLVMSQIRQATSDLRNDRTWTSQPGMIRVFNNVASSSTPRSEPHRFYKLYSARIATLGGNEADQLLDDTDEFSAADWHARPSLAAAMYADLNEPVAVQPVQKQRQDQNTTSTAIYPIFDPAAIGVVDGVNYNLDALQGSRVNAHPYPMPVLWLYVLRDGTLVPPRPKGLDSVTVPNASATNPIVGRIAYWTDDESSKLNLNTATEPAPWETPHTTSTTDRDAARSIPAKGEFYRMSGHPAYTSLAPALRNLGKAPGATSNQPDREPQLKIDDTDWWNHISAWHDLLPRTFLQKEPVTGSKGGFKETASEAIPKQERLFTTVDEFFFDSERKKNGEDSSTGSTSSSGPLITQEGLRAARFVLTTHSRSPDLTPFNRPKVSLWPVQSDTTKRNEMDKLFIAASTVGNAPYYLQRKSVWDSETDPGSSQNQDDDMTLVDGRGQFANLDLFQYVLRMSSQDIPGFGHKFVDPNEATAGKYTLESCDQLIASMFDMIRWGVNPATPQNQLIEHTLLPEYRFLPPGLSNGRIGAGSALPLRVRDFGSVMPTADMTLETQTRHNQNGSTAYAKSHGRFVTFTEASLVFAATKAVENLNGDIKDDNGDGFGDETTEIRAFLVLEPFNVAPGAPSASPTYRYSVFGLNGLSVESQSLNMPARADHRIRFSTLTRNGPHGGSSPYLDLAPEFLQENGTPRKGDDNDEDIGYASTSTAPVNVLQFPEPNRRADSQIHFSGGKISVEIQDDQNLDFVQVIDLEFPPADIPMPLVAASNWQTIKTLLSTDPENWTKDRFTPTDANSSRMGKLIFRGDVVRSIELSGPLSHGDTRLLSGRKWVPIHQAPDPALPAVRQNWFYPHPDYMSAPGTVDDGHYAHSLRDGGSPNVLGVWDNNREMPPNNPRTSPLVVRRDNTALRPAIHDFRAAPAVASDQSSAVNASGRPGDFDNGPGLIEDGPYINAPDVNNSANELAATGGWFQRGGQFADEDGFTYSPWRQTASAVMFGSLPTGVYGVGLNPVDPRPQPWQTLLFCPNPPSRDPQFTRTGAEPQWQPGIGDTLRKDHFGFATPRDHLWLEFFRMPVVEPAGYSDNVSTEGKVNMNFQLMPFTWIKRSTAMMGALHGVRVTAIPTTAATANSGALLYKNPDPASASTLEFRYAVNAEKTLQAFEDRFNGVGDVDPDVFRSPSEICEMFLVPQRLKNPDHTYVSGQVQPVDPDTVIRTYKDTQDWWEGQSDSDPTDGFEATGDNLREAPYAQLYPRLCTKSNVFTVHYRVQLLNKSRSTQPNEWNEIKDNIAADYRGQTTIERYLNQDDVQNNARIPNFITSDDPSKSLDDFYRFRIINRRVFAP